MGEVGVFQLGVDGQAIGRFHIRRNQISDRSLRI